MNGELTDFGSGGDYPEPTYVVGIGASAGGLEALERFFHSMPADTGMAFVVVQHLSPDFVSVMDELLVRQTDLPVFTVQNGMHVRPNAVYLIPPKKEMIISEGKLLLTDKDPKQGLTLPIDIFFRSLAQDLGPRAIGIVLSGTGSDGSRGIRHIHEMGGLVIVQNEETAKFDGMPRSALATGVVDLVVSPDQMADSLAKYAAHPIARDLAAAARPVPVDETGMNKVLRLLRVAYGIDFSLYKPTTVLRRIERRLMLSQLLNFDQYVEQLSSVTAELNALYRDLLIGVTQFFRDKEAFGIVESLVLPELLARLGGSEEARIWVAGCATGEEAYSLAIVIHEQLARLHRPLNVKIFATDVHQASLDVASLGVYAESSLADVSLERLKRYFLRKGEQWQVVPELRQMIVFAPHNIIKDAPFTRLDLVSCRNLLIYFQPAAQKKAISLFHFGLKPNGVLLLGPSEGLGELEDEFTAVDRQWKVYRKRRDVRLLTDLRLPSVGVAPGTGDRQRGSGGSQSADPDLVTAYDQLLSSYVPPAVLIDRKRQIVHVFGSAADYLQFKPGRTSSDVVELIREELRTPLSGAIQRVSKELTPVQFLGVCSRSDAETREVRMSVRPLLNRTSELTHLLVLLEETPPVIRSDVPGESPAGIELGEVNYARIESLESELRHSQESLHAAVEELETSNEELQATNEELVASNEELQSTNEELHSVNEELYTVNAEYQRKITELTELTDDMENLLVSTGVGVLFLDRDLGIRKFTPAIAGSFHIVAQDVGRPFDSFTHNIEHPGLIDDVRAVLASGETFEKEVRDRFGHWYLLRILPYQTRQRSGQNRPADVDDPEGAPRELRSSPPAVEGVVVTLIDIGSLKETQEALREKDRQLRGILDNSPAFVFIKDLQGRYLMANRQSRRVLRAAADKVLGKTDYDFLPRPVADRLAAQDRAVANTGETHETEETIRQNGRPRVYLSTKYPLRDELGRPLAIAGICTDISRQKRAERRARLAVEYRDRFLAMLSHELRNPLAAVQNATQLLERLARIQDGVPERERLAAGDADDVRRVSEVLRRQSDQMARLLDDLLDIS
ncbi:MAG: chemotaxis protein CheB, partial [Pirellulaceae bacterium]